MWPSLLTLFLLKKEVWKNTAKILITIILTSIAWRIYLVNNGAEWSRLYYASDTRIDAFIIGGLLAFIQPKINSLYKNTLLFKNLLIALCFCILLPFYFWDPKIKY